MSLPTKFRDRLSCFVRAVIGSGIIRVQGNSMVPLAQDGDFILSRPLTWLDKIQVGDVVVVRHPDLGFILKAVSLIEAGSVKLEGLSFLSSNPEYFGLVRTTDIKILAVAVVPKNINFSWRCLSFELIRRSKTRGLLESAKTLH